MKHIVLFGLVAFCAPAWAAEPYELSRYPTRRLVKQILEKNPPSVLIRSNYAGPIPSRVAYPSGVHTRHLNRLAPMPVEVAIDVTSYPSRNGIRHLNSLGDHVITRAIIRNCLSSRSEEQRLRAIERPMRIRIECPTDRSTQEARERAKRIKNENLRIRVKREIR